DNRRESGLFFLRPHEGINVRHRPDPTADSPFLVPHRQRLRNDPSVTSISTAQTLLRFEGPAGLHAAEPLTEIDPPVVGMQGFGPPMPGHLFQRLAGEPAPVFA